MTNEIAQATANNVAIPNGISFGFETVTQKDIKVPLIHIAQAMSKVVDNGRAKPGDIVETMEGQVLAPKGGTVKVVPYYFQKSYQVQKLVENKKEFHAIEPYDRERQYEEIIDGTQYFNYPCFNFFVLVLGDATQSKYMLSFRGARNITSAGRPMLTQLMNSMQRKIPPYGNVYDIGVKQVENEKGKWYVFTANPDRETSVPTDIFNKAMAEAVSFDTLIKGGATISSTEEITEEDAPF